jgi:hypothetical protein
MKRREITGNIMYYLDLLLPPLIRNSFIFSKIFKLEKFKSDIITQNQEIIKNYYTSSSLVEAMTRKSDLSKKSLNMIKDVVAVGNYKKICDLGGGNFFLKNNLELSFGIDVDVLDFNYSDKNYKNDEYNLEEKLYNIEDNSFDLCISTHTIEHLLNSKQFLNEMKRISSKAILLVFPKQIPYEPTPDTHINFYPYKFEVEKLFGKIENKQKQLIDLKYDWFYFEKL